MSQVELGQIKLALELHGAPPPLLSPLRTIVIRDLTEVELITHFALRRRPRSNHHDVRNTPGPRGTRLEISKAVGIPRRLSPTTGIAVDHRRINLADESPVTDAQRLKEYHARLIVFPRKSKSPAVHNVEATQITKSAFTIEGAAASVSKIKKDAMPQGAEAERTMNCAWADTTRA
ncbi:ribosomal protein L13e-domain-containing protein [Nemania abortiva]|nr:ribosomal protein L13e-domain-containing protein [Nemania abortiva]